MNFPASALGLLCLAYAVLGISLLFFERRDYKILGVVSLVISVVWMIVFLIKVAVIPYPF